MVGQQLHLLEAERSKWQHCEQQKTALQAQIAQLEDVEIAQAEYLDKAHKQIKTTSAQVRGPTILL